VLALLEGGYAIYLATDAVANGASQTTWILAIGFALLAAFGTRFARAILEQPSHRRLALSLGAAAGHLLFAIRGLFIGPAQPFLVLAALAIAIGLASFWAMRQARRAA
jgi:hypothetical protein